ncbi:MAG: isoaspartyl peptidase/L-asparaginase [bacterium]|nr:isoaspartyl peptidase/L-asparaginase [bacterium]
MKTKSGIAVHGGAGTILRSSMTTEKENLYRAGLQEALTAGWSLLREGKSSVDAVQTAVTILENNPLFNAGKGSVFNHNGKHSMDASIMEGETLNAGAVAYVSGVKNPVILARKIMDDPEFVFLSGKGAEDFAREMNLRFEDEKYFYDEYRFRQYKEALKENSVQLDHSPSIKEKKFGTVGAVALDSEGNLAAATSTGGMTNTKFGRIGDTPMIGAGTYANNKTCAVSCTGNGEFFIRAVAAYDVSALMEYKNYTLKEAGEYVVNEKLISIDGEGGLIAIDKDGNICMPFNSEGMYRASVSENSEIEISIYK